MDLPAPDPQAAPPLPAGPPPEPPIEEPSLAEPFADPHEAAWLNDSDAAQEAVFANVGAGLLLGKGVVPSGRDVQRLGRNLLTEAEQAHAQRQARGILGDAGGGSSDAQNADDLASDAARQAGIEHLRQNGDSLIGSLSTRQAKAAQRLLDAYADLSHLRASPDELERLIPAGQTQEQARWVIGAKRELADAVLDAPDDVREAAEAFGEGNRPAEWFAQASELSDLLARARTKAAKTDPEAADRLAEARALLEQGTSSESLWGAAAKQERQRSAGYERRYGDHVDSFEASFTSRMGDRVIADPEKFRAFVAGDQTGDAKTALDSMLASARATADVAAKFGKPKEAAAILGAARALERSLGAARTVRAAGGGVPRETAADASQAALAFLSGSSEPATPDQTRAGVLKATGAMTAGFAARRKAAVDQLLSPTQPDSDEGAESDIPAPEASADVTRESFSGTREHIDRMARDPQYFASVMASSFGRLGEAAPEIYQALSVQTAKTVQYLAAVAPGGNSGGPFARDDQVGDDDLWEFNQRVRATADPEFVAAELGAGRLSAVASEAFAQLLPRQFSQLRIDVFERLHEMRQQGVDPSPQARDQLETLLGIDGGGDPALTWDTAEKATAATKRMHESQSIGAGGDKPSAYASSMTSGALSTLNKGASAIARSGT